MRIMSEERNKEIFLGHFTKQYGEEAAAELYEQLPDCTYAKAIAEAAYRETLKKIEGLNKYPQCKGIVITVEDWESLKEGE